MKKLLISLLLIAVAQADTIITPTAGGGYISSDLDTGGVTIYNPLPNGGLYSSEVY